MLAKFYSSIRSTGVIEQRSKKNRSDCMQGPEAGFLTTVLDLSSSSRSDKLD